METRLLTAVGPVTEQTAQAIRDLVSESAKESGVAPISEQPLLWLQDPRAHVAHILAICDNSLVAYAQADLSSNSEVTLELAVSTSHRDEQLERRLLEAGSYVAEQNNADYSVWLHGPYTSFVPTLQEHGFRPVRSLSRRATALHIVDDAPDPAAPADPAHNVSGRRHAAESSQSPFTIRTFVPGQDDAAWVAVNADAFSWHPEQGRLTLKDLQARMKEPWFDPELFLVAESVDEPGALDGFAWLKIVPGSSTGEVYAIATAPRVRGRGLGKELFIQALELLHARGMATVDLYVESTNETAIALYDSFGFEEVERHVKLTRPAQQVS